VLALTAAVAIGGCGAAATVAPSGGVVGGPSLTAGVPAALAALPVAAAHIGDLDLLVAVADTPGTRRRGLMEISDLGGLDGMVFVFDAPTTTGFHMKNVPASLDIAFIDADGLVLDVLTMAACPGDPCPIHRSPAPFLWALEAPAGVLTRIMPGDRFSLAEPS
jgi:uncharacterized membrane protein (UPF0127 family)